MTIRDFLYLDADFLRSLYAQAFEGVTEQFIEENRASEARSNSLSSSESSTYITAELGRESLRNESRVLHDFMFTRLQERLSPAIFDVNANDDPSTTSSRLQNEFLISIQGKADLDDYDRMLSFVGDFDKIAGALATLTMLAPEHQALIRTAEELYETSKGSDKAEANKLLKSLRDKSAYTRQMMGDVNDDILTALSTVVRIFREGSFEVVLRSDDSALTFRSVLDTQWLRISKERLRILYGSHSSFNLKVLGQVTRLTSADNAIFSQMPEGTAPAQSDQATNQNIFQMHGEEAEANHRMSDAFKVIIKGIAGVESHFLQSGSAEEVVIRPLAIYREVRIDESK
jgi:hypothetical protein